MRAEEVIRMMLLPLLLALAVLALVPMRHHDPARRALGLRRAGLGWTLAFAVLAGLFVIGETGIDPGGWQAAALDASWLVPMLALGALAWWRPGVAEPVLIVATVVALATDAVEMVVGDHGRGADAPVGTISLFAVAVAVGVLGWHRPKVAGWLLLAVAVLPTVIELVGTDVPLHGLLGGSTAAGTVPFVVVGVLYALAAHQQAAADRPTDAPPRATALR